MHWFFSQTHRRSSCYLAENVGVHDPDLFEGDMILSEEQIRRAENGEDIDSSRKRGSSRFRMWPNGVVPYVIDASLSESTFSVTIYNCLKYDNLKYYGGLICKSTSFYKVDP